MSFNDLKKEIPYKWRKGPGGTQLAYIDARQVMDVLDEVVGAENWQCDYKELNGKMYCGIGIYTNSVAGYQWVWKWDMGTESDFEADKGEASDAFKRAAVKWGIGRFLYDIKPGIQATTSTKVAKSDWKDSKPSEKQVKACAFKLNGKDRAEFTTKLYKNLTAGLASDFIGNNMEYEDFLAALRQ